MQRLPVICGGRGPRSQSRSLVHRPRRLVSITLFVFLAIALGSILPYSLLLRTTSIEQVDTRRFANVRGTFNPVKNAEDSASNNKPARDDATPSLHTPLDTLGKLTCDAYGGPFNSASTREMVYWRDIPEDRAYKSPFRSSSPRKEEKYVSVELDAGGFNNLRMTLEIGMALAHATGRTFVLPPKQGIYLLQQRKQQEQTFSLHDFYNLEGMDVMEMQDFLEQEVMSGSIPDGKGHRVFPPGNRTNWTDTGLRDTVHKDFRSDSRQLDYFLRTISMSPTFHHDEKLIFVPERPDASTKQHLADWEQFVQHLHEGTTDGGFKEGQDIDRPPLVNASAQIRLQEAIKYRQLWPYDKGLQKARLIHIMEEDYDEKPPWIRIMTHFYHVLFFEDWKMDLAVKRFVRDKLRYRDEFFCAAARIVENLREYSRAAHHGQGGGLFYTFHVRRNDFAHIELIENAETLIEYTKDIVPSNAVVYIATDERDKSWFDPLRERFHHVYFLDDFAHLIENVKPSYYGLVDEIVAARGEAFVGAYFSTFTSHIIHMRGYYSQVEKKPGWEMGILNNTFYATEDVAKRNIFQKYRPFGDENVVETAFPIAWRDIDKGVIASDEREMV